MLAAYRSWSRPVVFVIVVTLLGLSVGSVGLVFSATSSDHPEVSAFAVVGGEKVKVDVGDVIAVGTREGDFCVFDEPISYGGETSKHGVTGEIAYQMDDQCRLTIENIEALPDDYIPVQPEGAIQFRHTDISPKRVVGNKGPGVSAPAQYIGSLHKHYMWTKSTVLEQFGVTATEVYVIDRFWQEEEDVFAPHGLDGWCYASAFPTWTVNDCYGDATDGDPYYQEVEGFGDYSHSLGVEYVQRAEHYYTSSGESWQCNLTEGALPILWSFGTCGHGFGNA